MSKTFLSRNWRGETQLWRVYWLYGVAGSTVLTILIAVYAAVE